MFEHCGWWEGRRSTTRASGIEHESLPQQPFFVCYRPLFGSEEAPFLVVDGLISALSHGGEIITDHVRVALVDKYLAPVIKRRSPQGIAINALALCVSRPYTDDGFSFERLPEQEEMSTTYFEELLKLMLLGKIDLPDDFWPFYTEYCIDVLERIVVGLIYPSAWMKNDAQLEQAKARLLEMLRAMPLGSEAVKAAGGVPVPRLNMTTVDGRGVKRDHGRLDPCWKNYPCRDSQLEARRLRAVNDLVLYRNYGPLAI
jgi:hypothetical protein